jgi:KaiC/GvpD/RAD55 family RecA-like ATPase
MTTAHLDINLEWRLLAHLMDEKYYDYIYKLKRDIFTLERQHVFDAIKQCHMTYGVVTPDGIETFYGKPSPTDLDVHVGTQIDILIDRLYNVATHRQVADKARRLDMLSKEDVINFKVLYKELEFEPLLQEEDGSVLTGSQELLSKYQRKEEGTYHWVRTGFPTLDEYLGGEWPRELMLLGGTPGTGKTVLAFQSQIEMAMEYGTRSTMINLEMGKDALIARGAAHIAEVNISAIKKATLTPEEKDRFIAAVNKINELPIDIVCARGKDVHWIIGIIREYALKGSKVFFVDHLQLIRTASMNRNLELGEVTDLLKTVADKYGVHIVLLTQLTEKGKDDWTVRDSGVVETLVDTFVVIHTEDKDKVRRVYLSFKKNREGELGQTDMLFYGEYQRFVDGMKPRKLLKAYTGKTEKLDPTSLSMAAD